MGSDSIPRKTISDEGINRGLVFAHIHSLARTQKILTFVSNAGKNNNNKTNKNRPKKSHTQHVLSTKTECDCINGWIKNGEPRDIAGVLLFVVWLLNVPATCECISGTDLHRQFYVLPH